MDRPYWGSGYERWGGAGHQEWHPVSGSGQRCISEEPSQESLIFKCRLVFLKAPKWTSLKTNSSSISYSKRGWLVEMLSSVCRNPAGQEQDHMLTSGTYIREQFAPSRVLSNKWLKYIAYCPSWINSVKIVLRGCVCVHMNVCAHVFMHVCSFTKCMCVCTCVCVQTHPLPFLHHWKDLV